MHNMQAGPARFGLESRTPSVGPVPRSSIAMGRGGWCQGVCIREYLCSHCALQPCSCPAEVASTAVRFVSVCLCATVADRYLVAALGRVVVGERLPAVGAVRGSCDGFVTGFAVCAAVAALACCASPLLTLVPAVWALAVALV
jgi:hypothetical protein